MKVLHGLICIAATGMVVLLSGCAANLEPAPAATRVAGLEDAAKATAQVVTVLVQADEWPVDIDEEVTPLRIRLDNDNAKPLRVRFNEFNLIAPDSTSFSARPLERIEGDVAVRVHHDPPGFNYRDFSGAPYYSPFYPGISAYLSAFAYDPYYYGSYYDYWAEIGLPTPEMRLCAIPEGVIETGGSLEGWMFFEKVDDDLERISFRADLVNAQNGKEFAEVRIPFSVE